MKIYTIWPSDKDGNPASSSSAWRQSTRWLVLDVTGGLDNAKRVEGPVPRERALAMELALRCNQRKEQSNAEG